jgi:YegS/Rv2252/BmrU family lipid kinase
LTVVFPDISQSADRAGSAVLVVNGGARRGREDFERARDLLAEAGISATSAHLAGRSADVERIVAEAVAAGAMLVVVGGGDGTISAVVDHLAYKETLLGVLPLGTANSFARSVGIPLDLEGAVDVIARGREARIDLGKVGDDFFANLATVGVSASIGDAMPEGVKGVLGRLSYPIVGAIRLFQHPRFYCVVTGEAGNRQTCEALEIQIANGRFQGGLEVASEAKVRSGDLVVQIMKGSSRWRVVGNWARLAVGLGVAERATLTIRVKEALIEAEPPQPVAIDGDRTTHTPIEISVASDALRIMLPG